MVITDVQPILVNPGQKVDWGTGHGKNWVFVKITTDGDVHGVGEAFGTGQAKTVEAALLGFKRWLVGTDPSRIIHSWQALYRGARYPMGTTTLAALSAVEQALWDIAGKRAGLPVYRLLGGPCRDRIRTYASVSLVGPDLAAGASQVVDAGFTALKLIPQPPDFATQPANAVLDSAVDRVRSVREAVGPAVDICLDYHGRSFSPSDASRLAQALEPFRPMFLEEPALSENPDSLREVKQRTTIPIAAGERCIDRSSMRDLIAGQAVHIIQPEPAANGGILQTVYLAAMAELYHITVAPHHASSPLSLLVCAHIAAVTPNFLIQECNVDLSSSCAQRIFRHLPRIEDGYLPLPERPGLGLELDEDAARDYPYRPSDRPIVFRADGSVGLE